MRNKYKISLIVPMYNEGENVIKQLLDSVELQQNVDFDDIEVVVVNDGGDESNYLSDEFISNYSFDIKFLKKEHAGVSAARNYGLDNCSGEYVMFCDCDDMFYNMCGLWIIFNEIDNNGGFDSLTSVFVEETRNPETKDILYINREMDSTFVHGKVHKRKYLIKQNIRWDDKLTIHEDSYFNILCQNLSEKVKYCQSPFYLWKWRDESVCRHDPKYILKTYNNMLDSTDALISELKRRNMDKHCNLYCCSSVFDAYYTMNKKEWVDQENQEYRNAVEKHFSEWFKKWKYIWDRVPENERIQLSNGIRQRGIQEGAMLMENITLKDWLDHIEKL